MDFLQHLVDAPVANILIVAGLLFLGIGAVGKVTGKIEPDRAGRLVTGVLGLILLIVGVLIHVGADATIKITPNQAQNVLKPAQNSPIQPIVHVFSVTPAEITKGNKVTIRWEVQNADQVDLEPFGQVSPTGTTIDQPQKTTVYKLSASNKGGEKAGDFREVIVNEPKAPPSNPIPNFAGTWELTEYTFNGRTVPVTNARRITITQSGSLVRMGNKELPIDAAGRVTYQDFYAGDNKAGHAVNTEAEADLVDTLTWRLDGPILIFETTFRYQRRYGNHPPGTDFRTIKYRRVSP